MSHYKGYEISTTTLHAQRPGVTGQTLGVTETAYVVRMGETVVRKGAVPGPFVSMENAHSAGELAARGWIDRYAPR